MFCYRRFAPIWTLVVVVSLLFLVTRVRQPHPYQDMEDSMYYRSVDTLFTSEKDSLLEWTRSSKQPLEVDTDHWLDVEPVSK
jgi:hypothetical protein